MRYQKALFAATGNVNIGNASIALFDGATALTLPNGSSVFLFNQTTPAQNGLWVWQANGAALLRPAALTNSQFTGGNKLDLATAIWVTSGNTLAGKVFGVDPALVYTVDTTNQLYAEIALPSIQVRVASTVNVTVAAPNVSAIDGVTLANGDLVLLKDQTTASENGVYTWQGSASPMIRSPEPMVPNRDVRISEGAASAHAHFKVVTQGPLTLGTTSVSFSPQNIFCNVKDFGAKGDGTSANPTDDTVAIRNAIAVAAANGGGTVFFPTATYRITGTLAIPAKVILQGNNSTLAYSNPSGPAIDGSSSYPLGVVVQDLTINLVSPLVYTILGINIATTTITVSDTVGLVNGQTVYGSAGTNVTGVAGAKIVSNINGAAGTFQINGPLGGGPWSQTGVFTALPIYAGATSTASNPIQIGLATTAGLANGQTVMISGMTAAAANGPWIIQNLTATTFELFGSDGTGFGVGTGGLVTPIAVGVAARFSYARFKNVAVATFEHAPGSGKGVYVQAPGQTAFLLPGDVVTGLGPHNNTFTDCGTSGHSLTYDVSGRSASVTVDGAPFAGATPVVIKISSVVGNLVGVEWSTDGFATFTGASILQTVVNTITLGSTGLTAHFPIRSYSTSDAWGYSSGQTGWCFTAGLTRGPNGNRFFAGHTTLFETGWRILGNGNTLYGPSVESVTGQAFAVQHPVQALGANANAIYGSYLENVGIYGFSIGNNALDTAIYDPLITGAGTAFLDSGQKTRIFSDPTFQVPDVTAASLTTPSVLATTALTVGSVASAAATGAVRLPNSTFVMSKSALTGGDIKLIYLDSFDEIGIGGAAVANVELAAKAGSAGGYVGAFLNGTAAWSFGYGGGGDNVMYLLNALTPPNANPTGGGFLYARSGAAKWRGLAGSITTIAPDGVSQGSTPSANVRDEVDAQIRTTGAGVTNWDLYDLSTATAFDAVVYFTCVIKGVWTSGGTQSSVFEFRGAYEYVSGTATLLGTPASTSPPWESSSSGAAFTFTASVSKIRLRISGAAATTDWLVALKVQVYSK